ncbi:MAG: hypothetical protein ABW321_30265 [Polyangiales bacterium]
MGDAVVLSTWAFERVGPVMVLCSGGERPPPEQDFSVWATRLANDDFCRLLIYSEGGSPSARQRARIAEVMKSSGRSVRVALMTDSQLARGFLTAIEWLIGAGNMRALPLAELNAGLRWLEAEDSAREVAQVIARLRAALRTHAARAG